MAPPPAVVTDINALFVDAYTIIAADRAERSLPVLVPAALSTLQIGAEYLPQEQDAPRIVIVPTRFEYEYISPQPISSQLGKASTLSAKSIFTRWMLFEAHIWSNPDPGTLTASSPYFDFNSAIELEREFHVAMRQTCGGAAYQPLGAEWLQPTNDTRRGRLLVVSFRIATPVTETPHTFLPYSTVPGDGGVVGKVTIQATSPDGTQTETVGVINAPPPIP